MSAPDGERLRDLRRRFHRHPEPAWREFRTTAAVVDELRRIGVDELAVGADAMDPEARMAVPDEQELSAWIGRAREAGVDSDLLNRMSGGYTGAVAVLRKGDGPSVGLRVDIDGLPIKEADGPDHAPSAADFRSEHEGYMHACGHDAHIAIGLGVLESVDESDFEGTFIVFFQPAEEESGGGKAFAVSDYVADLDYLLAVHVGLDHPTGEVVAGIVRPLAMSHLAATFNGTPAHAGMEPNEGDNAIQALAAAVQNAFAIPRHEDGMTRVNVGRVEGGTASNVIAKKATLLGEIRGETTPLRDYMKVAFRRAVESAAAMHGCDVSLEVVSESPRADSDEALVDVIADVAQANGEVTRVRRFDDLGASEDATFLMRAVQNRDGLASYVVVGTDHPSSHHTSTFDVDERSLDIGVSVLTDAVLATAQYEQ